MSDDDGPSLRSDPTEGIPLSISRAMGTMAKLQRNVAIISAASNIARYCVTSGVFLATGAAMSALRSTAWLASRNTLSMHAEIDEVGNSKLQLLTWQKLSQDL